MPTAENAKLDFEAGQNLVAMVALSDSTDHITFGSVDDLWSKKNGFLPVIVPNGMKSGGVITLTAINNDVAVSAGVCNLNGVPNVSVSADTSITLTRTAAGDVFQINSIQVNSSGVYVCVAGTEGPALIETRGAAGGPPFVPVLSIEVGQIRFTGNTAAVVAASEIKQVVGVHMEKYNYPLHQVRSEDGGVEFVAALPLIHTGSVAKSVYAEYYTPIFTTIPRTSDVTLPETSASVSSEQIYGEVLNSVARSLGQAAFKCKLEDGITDLVVAEKGNNLWFKFYPDMYRTGYVRFQGVLSIARTFPAGGFVEASCTISAEATGQEQES